MKEYWQFLEEQEYKEFKQAYKRLKESFDREDKLLLS